MIDKNSKSPYILKIKPIKNNNGIKLLNKALSINHDKTKFSPTSGSEYEYDPKLWNKISKIKDTHNCYSYALGKIIPEIQSKAQPGYSSAFNYINDRKFNCEEFKSRLKKDNPGSYITNFDKSCIKGFYKVFLALDIAEDYHWWRQDKNSYWSHKPGSTEVTNLDADGKKIINPLLSNRNFPHRNYSTPCFFACVYSNLTRSLDEVYDLKK